MQILLSKEHAQYSKEVVDCFEGLDAKVDASYMYLSEYGYPPDLEKLATDNILKQVENLAEEWNSSKH